MKIGVIGAGTMGSGIAQTFAQKEGFEVMLCDINETFAANGKNKIAKGFEKRVAKGKMEAQAAEAILAKITTGTKEICADCDLVIEAAIENMEIKKQTFKEFIKKFPPEKYPDKEEFYKKLIMASIIEREAVKEDEKPLIASAFYNRMKKGMTLSSDATVNYLYDYSKKRIYYKDLEIDSPYNTYKYKGLPPSPIANPDIKSVEAAYNPSDTKYLFFVAKGNGYHYFSKTYEEHLEFQRKNRQK